MTADFVPHVFERFRQADASSARTHAGLGLGLTITRHLVEAHGGTIRAESDGAGMGSAFILRIPVSVVASEARSDRPSGHRLPSSHGKPLPEVMRTDRLAGLTILIVEDEPDSRETLQLLLEQNGAIVVAAGSVADAFAAIDAGAPDIVISDIGMPGVTGFDLVARLRQVPTAAAAIPVIALSAYASAEDRASALAHGFDEYLTKPVTPSDLMTAIASVDRRFSRRAGVEVQAPAT